MNVLRVVFALGLASFLLTSSAAAINEGIWHLGEAGLHNGEWEEGFEAVGPTRSLQAFDQQWELLRLTMIDSQQEPDGSMINAYAGGVLLLGEAEELWGESAVINVTSVEHASPTPRGLDTSMTVTGTYQGLEVIVRAEFSGITGVNYWLDHSTQKRGGVGFRRAVLEIREIPAIPECGTLTLMVLGVMSFAVLFRRQCSWVRLFSKEDSMNRIRRQQIIIGMLVGLSVITGPSRVLAQDAQETLGTFLIPKMVESAEQGLFLDLLREIERHIGVSFTVKVWPPQRTYRYFQDGQISGIFPVTDVKQQEIVEIVVSDVFYVKRDLIFSRKDLPLTRLEDLEGKRVGLTFGYTYPPELTANTNIQILYTNDDVTNMKNLALGRIDAFVVEEFSGLKALEVCDCSEEITYDPQAYISASSVTFGFQPTERGFQLVEQFSKAIQDMKQDGTLQRILHVSEAWIRALPQHKEEGQ